MSVSFKAFLYKGAWGGDPIETRRFNVDQDSSTDYSHLQQKVSQVFSTVTTGNMSLAWTDNDGDLIAISSDEELVEALGQFDGSLFKLYILKSDNGGTTGGQACGQWFKKTTSKNQQAGSDACDEQMRETFRKIAYTVSKWLKPFGIKLDFDFAGCEENQTLAAPDVTPEVVEQVLAKLKSMGYEEDGGWLTSLIKVKGGDLTKVLDALKYTKKD